MFTDLNPVDGTCRVCGGKGKVVSVCSSVAPITYSVCKQCAENRIEPYDILVDCIAVNGLRWPDDVSDYVKDCVKRCLWYFEMPESQFEMDIDLTIQEIEEMERGLTDGN